MLYLFDDYISEAPNKNSSIFGKFQDLQKNLHEMSVEEIDDVLSDEEYTANTIQNYRSYLRSYLDWLLAHGVDCDLSIADKIKFNESKAQYLIFSADDIHKQYEILFDFAKELYGAKFTRTTYFLSYAAGILAFYGINPEDILKLDYDAISKNGVRGYELPLSKKDIDVLLSYQAYKGRSGKLGFGGKYIRTEKPKLELKPEYMSRPIWKLKYDKEHAYLQQILNVVYLYKLGRFARMYERELTSPEKISMLCKNPKWFTDEFSEYNSQAALTNVKKDYLAYKAEREANCETPQQKLEKVFAEVRKKPISASVTMGFGGGGKVAYAPSQLDAIESELHDCINTMQDLAPRLARLAELVAELKEQDLIKF